MSIINATIIICTVCYGTEKRKLCLYMGIVGEGFSKENMPEINVDVFAE